LDLQFPNGQLTYSAGEGISASGFLPLFGGLLQAQGKLFGESRVSFSVKVSILYYVPYTPSFLVYKARADTTQSSKLYLTTNSSYIVLFVVMNL
jgi:hypothetical protein